VDVGKIRFLLYTKEQTSVVSIRDHDSVIESTFNPNRGTKIFIHNWLQDALDAGLDFVSTFLLNGDDNLIKVDYTAYSNCDYESMINRVVPAVGQELGKLIQMLVDEMGSAYIDFTISGLGLGAHIAGYAGKFDEKMKVKQVLALDPFGPGFDELSDDDRFLDESSANFVQVIHTSWEDGLMGTQNTMGHADFYVTVNATNDNAVSPLVLNPHMAYLYGLESVICKERFPGLACDTWKQYEEKNCPVPFEYKNMGAGVGKNVYHRTRGRYYLNTNAYPPFGKAFLECECQCTL